MNTAGNYAAGPARREQGADRVSDEGRMRYAYNELGLGARPQTMDSVAGVHARFAGASATRSIAAATAATTATTAAAVAPASAAARGRLKSTKK